MPRSRTARCLVVTLAVGVWAQSLLEVAHPLRPDSLPVQSLGGAGVTRHLRHEYSRHDPLNADKSLILLCQDGDWKVCRTDLVPYDDHVVCRLKDLEEPRWDPKDPDLLWCVQGFKLVRFQPSRQRLSLLKDFSLEPAVRALRARHKDLYRVTMKDEGEPSQDFRWWALLVQGSADDYRARYLLVWDRQLDRVAALRPLSKAESDIDWVGMSPWGNYVLIGGGSDNASPLQGLTLADTALTRFSRLNFDTAHADVGVDLQGHEVIVMQNNRTDFVDLIPLDWQTRPILESAGSYVGTGRRPLLQLPYGEGFGSGIHISCNSPGLCLVSGYSENTPVRHWMDCGMFLIRLDSSRVYYLGRHSNRTGDYWQETHGCLSRDGRTVLWADNGGRGPSLLHRLELKEAR